MRQGFFFAVPFIFPCILLETILAWNIPLGRPAFPKPSLVTLVQAASRFFCLSFQLSYLFEHIVYYVYLVCCFLAFTTLFIMLLVYLFEENAPLGSYLGAQPKLNIILFSGWLSTEVAMK